MGAEQCGNNPAGVQGWGIRSLVRHKLPEASGIGQTSVRSSTVNQLQRLGWLLLLAACSKAADPQAAQAKAFRECEALVGPPESRLFVQCLVDRHQWNPESAFAVVKVKAESIQKVRDSIAKERDDSIEIELAKFRDSLHKADSTQKAKAAQAWYKAQAAEMRAERAKHWYVVSASLNYYKGDCKFLDTIPASRIEYSFMEEQGAQNAGFKRADCPK